jgi:(1->4)-alpha-D-glucan 1-alpha-D-glucosylmutase
MPTPTSTYRLQYHPGFTFRDAVQIIPYLHDLGISHVYASPYLKPTPGSTHGYDVIDPSSLNPDLGSESDYDAFLSALKSHGMSHILDIVPNHVGVATNDNLWWNDVLENGPDSPFADYFDIAWNASPRPEAQDKLLLPVLGDPYAKALEDGQLKLKFEPEKAAFSVWYYDRRFPLSPHTYPAILHGITQLNQLSDEATNLTPAQIKHRLAQHFSNNSQLQTLIKKTVDQLNGTRNDPASFDSLDALLTSQHYRLAWWKVAPNEINYRRFFDINDLAALGMERQEVFDATHSLILRLLSDGKLTGLRIDHPDGLYDPLQYFQRLHQATHDPNLYIVVEKILAQGEPLPSDWPVSGTTGYDFLALANGLFIDTRAEEQFTRIYHDFTGERASYEDLAYQNKRKILRRSFSSELHMLACLLDRLAQRDRHSRDFTFAGLRDGLAEVIATFPVYRSYITRDCVHASDKRYVDRAINDAIHRKPDTPLDLFHFIGKMLLQHHPPGFTPDDREAQLRFAGKFQQLAAPVTAKGIEDTTFYNYNRLISLNEVGGDPEIFGTTPEALHAYLQHRQQRWPGGLSPLSTHDTKRSEDVRARLNVLSEIPDQWQQALARWRTINAPHRHEIHPNDEYLLYQTLLGAWPLHDSDLKDFEPRIRSYMQKALREGNSRTTWTAPNEPYETSVYTFISRLLTPDPSNPFLKDFLPFQKKISCLGLYNSLSQTLLRLTAPGVPDTYQGSELWDFSLVDPDNRRLVKYPLRRELLNTLRTQSVPRAVLLRHLLTSIDDGRIKLFMTQTCLALRREEPDLFNKGDYIPLQVTGPSAHHLFAFTRRFRQKELVVLIPRFFDGLVGESAGPPVGGAWGDTTILLDKPSRDLVYTNSFTFEPSKPDTVRLQVNDILSTYPWAMLFLA